LPSTDAQDLLVFVCGPPLLKHGLADCLAILGHQKFLITIGQFLKQVTKLK
jgi:hypothetical protein